MDLQVRRVRHGVEFLDRKNPDWRNRVRVLLDKVRAEKPQLLQSPMLSDMNGILIQERNLSRKGDLLAALYSFPSDDKLETHGFIATSENRARVLELWMQELDKEAV